MISDIVSDEPSPEHLQNDPELWSGCISGALTEDGFLEAFEQAGFYGIRLLKRDAQPWQTVEGIEFRSVTVEAFKGKQGPCFERNQAVIYKGPFKEVLDDDGHRMERGGGTRCATRRSTCTARRRTRSTSSSSSRASRSALDQTPDPSTAPARRCATPRRPRARSTPAPRPKPAPAAEVCHPSRLPHPAGETLVRLLAGQVIESSGRRSSALTDS